MCGAVFREFACSRRGAHYCEPRAERVIRFFAEVLVHTKGRWARSRFLLEPFQEHEIIRPLFGEVIWSQEWDCYVRRYRIAYIIVSRKTGKTEIAAGIVMTLLIGDDEEAAEIYGAATDTKQADKVGAVVERMRQLEPRLSARLGHNKHSMRTFDEKTGSYYELIPADALGELGANPHGFVLDEFLTQSGGDVWDALRTGAGTRTQPLFLGVSTETNDPASWGAGVIDEAERVAEDPSRAPHVFTFVRRAPRDQKELDRLHRLYPGHPDLPVSCDVFDEANWKWPNPALGSFLSVQSLREEAIEVKNEPAKENAFRQFRMNQRQAQASRWMPMDLYDACIGDVWVTPGWGRKALAGRAAWFGFDLAAKFDLTAWCLLVPDGNKVDLLWRFWLPQAAAAELDRHHDGKFSRWETDGWLTVTPGDVVDYETLYEDVAGDARTFNLRAGDGDEWSMAPVVQEIEKRTNVDDVVTYINSFRTMSGGMGELMSLVKGRRLRHHGNPVARFCFEAVEVEHRRDDGEIIRPIKPKRNGANQRVDAVPAAVMACNAWTRAPVASVPAVPDLVFGT